MFLTEQPHKKRGRFPPKGSPVPVARPAYGTRLQVRASHLSGTPARTLFLRLCSPSVVPTHRGEGGPAARFHEKKGRPSEGTPSESRPRTVPQDRCRLLSFWLALGEPSVRAALRPRNAALLQPPISAGRFLKHPVERSPFLSRLPCPVRAAGDVGVVHTPPALAVTHLEPSAEVRSLLTYYFPRRRRASNPTTPNAIRAIVAGSGWMIKS